MWRQLVKTHHILEKFNIVREKNTIPDTDNESLLKSIMFFILNSQIQKGISYKKLISLNLLISKSELFLNKVVKR
jgi:hypothetical protein